MKIILSNSELIIANKFNEHKDIFYSFNFSAGTLGILISAKLKIIKIKPYVKLEYH